MAVIGVSRTEADRLAELVGFDTALQMLSRLPIERVRAVLVHNGLTDQQQRPSGAPYVISVPGYEDVIHLEGQAQLSDGELQLIREVRKAYDPASAERILIDMIGAAKLRSYDRRVKTARRIAASPTPEIVRDIGEIMTAIDNVQDGLITLTYFARVISPVLARLAPKVLAKAVPVVGWISLAADILDLLQIVKWLQAPRATGKRGLKSILEFSARARGTKLTRVGSLRDLLPSFAEGIQVAQTTDWLFGYGVSLGPAFGFVQDALAGAVRYVVPGGRDITIDATPLVESDPVGPFKDLLWDYGASSSPRESVFARPLTSVDLAALSVLRSAPYVLRLGPLLPLSDHVSTLIGVHLAQQVLNRSGVMSGSPLQAHRVADAPSSGLRTSGTVKALLGIEGLLPSSLSQASLISEMSPRVSPRLQAALLAPKVVEGLNSSLEADKRNPLAVLAGRLIIESTPGLLRLYGGADVELESTVRPEFKPLFTLEHYGLTRRLRSDRASLERVLGALGAKYVESGRDQFTYDETIALIDLVDGFETHP